MDDRPRSVVEHVGNLRETVHGVGLAANGILLRFYLDLSQIHHGDAGLFGGD